MLALRLVLAALAVCAAAAEPGADATVDIAGDVSLAISGVVSVGDGLEPDTDSTTYGVTNTTGVKQIVGRLSTAMPSHTTLRVQLAAPSGASSSGPVTLTTSNQTLVAGIGVVAESGLSMTFTFEATVQAGSTLNSARTMTLTLVDGP
jgi:hypothetical protein